jgi:phosphoglucomutase
MPGAVERRAFVKERTATHGEFCLRRQARPKEMLIDLDTIRAAGLKLDGDSLGGAAMPYWEPINAIDHMGDTMR